MKLTNVEHLHSMTPGVLPDKELRDSLEQGWIVVLLDSNMARVRARISAVRGDCKYTGEVIPTLDPIEFESKHVLHIVTAARHAV